MNAFIDDKLFLINSICFLTKSSNFYKSYSISSRDLLSFPLFRYPHIRVLFISYFAGSFKNFNNKIIYIIYQYKRSMSFRYIQKSHHTLRTKQSGFQFWGFSKIYKYQLAFVMGFTNQFFCIKFKNLLLTH